MSGAEAGLGTAHQSRSRKDQAQCRRRARRYGRQGAAHGQSRRLRARYEEGGARPRKRRGHARRRRPRGGQGASRERRDRSRAGRGGGRFGICRGGGSRAHGSRVRRVGTRRARRHAPSARLPSQIRHGNAPSGFFRGGRGESVRPRSPAGAGARGVLLALRRSEQKPTRPLRQGGGGFAENISPGAAAHRVLGHANLSRRAVRHGARGTRRVPRMRAR